MNLHDRIEATLLADRTELHSSITVEGSLYQEFFRKGGEKAVRNSVLTNNPTTVDSGLTLTRQQAAQMAGYLRDTEWLEQGGEFKVYLPGTYKYLAPTDVVLIPWNSQTYRFRITEMSIEENLIVATLALDQAEVLLRIEAGSVPSNVAAQSNVVAPIALAVASIATDLSDAFSEYPGFYVFANSPLGFDPSNGKRYPAFSGCQIRYTWDAPGGTRSWVSGPVVPYGCAFGTCTPYSGGGSFPGILGDASAPGYETVNQVDIQFALPNAAPEGPMEQVLLASSASLVSVENAGLQWAFIGSEIVGVYYFEFPDSTNHVVVGPGLVRGLRGSPCTGHVASEQFAMAPSVGQTVKVKVDSSKIGSTVYVQALVNGAQVSGEVSCVIAQNNPVFVSNTPPVAPSGFSVSSTYNGQNELFTFTPQFGATVTTPQTYNWQYATSGDNATWSAWSSSVNLPGAYTPPAISSGYLKVQCQAQNAATPPALSSWVASGSQAYASPSTPQPSPVAPDSVAVSVPSWSGTTEFLVFSPVFSTHSPTPGQEYEWQWSADGSTWKGPDGTSATWYSGPNYQGSFTSGNLYVRCRAATNAGASSWFSSGAQAYSSPPATVSGYADNETPSGTINGANATFTCAHTPQSGSLKVYVRDQRLSPADFTTSSASFTITNSTYIPQSGDNFLVDYRY